MSDFHLHKFPSPLISTVTNLDIFPSFSHHNGQLHFPIKLFSDVRIDDIVHGANDRAGELAEDDRLCRNGIVLLRAVVHIVHANADDLLGVCDRGEELDAAPLDDVSVCCCG